LETFYRKTLNPACNTVLESKQKKQFKIVVDMRTSRA
jgi:hypothetical protein